MAPMHRVGALASSKPRIVIAGGGVTGRGALTRRPRCGKVSRSGGIDLGLRKFSYGGREQRPRGTLGAGAQAGTAHFLARDHGIGVIVVDCVDFLAAAHDPLLTT